MVPKPEILVLWFAFVLIIHSNLVILSNSKSIIKRLPGFLGDLPFKLETGYVGVGEDEKVQLFYYFVESTTNPKEDPLIFYIPGGPGASGMLTFLYEIGPLSAKSDSNHRLTLSMNPYTWTQMANIIFLDIPAGTGFSYAETKQGWISSDSSLAIQAEDFIRKFLKEHPEFLKNPLYIAGISYIGIVVPKITLDLYEGNERGDQPALNIQGYILCSPFTDKFKDFNSRFEYAHRMALISDDIYTSAIKSCHGNYVNIDSPNSLCTSSLHSYEECTSRIKLDNILEPFCDENDPKQDCHDDSDIEMWANNNVVQQALKIRQGTIGKWELVNGTMHYKQGKNDTFCYSGDHDMTFPYVGVEEWITSLNVGIEVPWKPFYVDGQVAGYETKYAQNGYSLTYATVKGAGHLVPSYKPKESIALIQRWYNLQTYVSDY